MGIRLRQSAGAIFTLIIAAMLIMLIMSPTKNEGFVDSGRCGVGLPSCTDGLRCMNGYCKSDYPPKLPELSDLPVRPPRYPYSK